ncbi:hypothetical protein M0R45_031947 [Rubus argutus]|uniref:Uncharacterized protein n=1 Tax=Rubus argutus TaxID=59490 RepID=A0AAW1WJP4_RUBAR
MLPSGWTRSPEKLIRGLTVLEMFSIGKSSLRYAFFKMTFAELPPSTSTLCIRSVWTLAEITRGSSWGGDEAGFFFVGESNAPRVASALFGCGHWLYREALIVLFGLLHVRSVFRPRGTEKGGSPTDSEDFFALSLASMTGILSQLTVSVQSFRDVPEGLAFLGGVGS